MSKTDAVAKADKYSLFLFKSLFVEESAVTTFPICKQIFISAVGTRPQFNPRMMAAYILIGCIQLYCAISFASDCINALFQEKSFWCTSSIAFSENKHGGTRNNVSRQLLNRHIGMVVQTGLSFGKFKYVSVKLAR